MVPAQRVLSVSRGSVDNRKVSSPMARRVICLTKLSIDGPVCHRCRPQFRHGLRFQLAGLRETSGLWGEHFAGENHSSLPSDTASCSYGTRSGCWFMFGSSRSRLECFRRNAVTVLSMIVSVQRRSRQVTCSPRCTSGEN